jgi:mannose-6-phosphate isomerase-like protein (cupin superfamily)
MDFFRPAEFTGETAWDALDVAEIEGASVRLHWTDEPYVWHRNDGDEVFVVLQGRVVMHYRKDGEEHRREMAAGEFCHASDGDEHVAHPDGAARILVIEKKGSV